MSKPFITWMGGKRRLAKHILPNFPDHQCYVEPFAGGAALFFMKQPSKVEVINDTNSDLVNLYRVVQNHLKEFVRMYEWSLVSREMFEWEKLKHVDTLTDIQRAARFYYLQQQGFGGRLNSNFGTSTTSGPGFNLLRIEETLSQAHMRLSRVFVENMDWKAIIKRYDRPHTLHYLDPPYWATAGYDCAFPFEEYEAMATLARDIQGKMIISINDHPDIRQVFSGFRIEEVGLNYTVGASNSKKAKELVIYNW